MVEKPRGTTNIYATHNLIEKQNFTDEITKFKHQHIQRFYIIIHAFAIASNNNSTGNNKFTFQTLIPLQC